MRTLLLIAILSLPLAAAGASETVNVQPDPASRCESDGYADSWGEYEWYPWGSYERYQSYSFAYGSCSYDSDTVNGSVESNDHQVVAFRYGQSSGDSWNASESESYQRTDMRWNDSSYGYGSRSASYSEGTSSYGHAIVEAETELATARVTDGCASSSSGGASWWQDYSYSTTYDNGSGTGSSSYSDHSDGWSSWSGQDGCGRNADLESGVTDVRAGVGQGCAWEGGSFSHSRYRWSGDNDSRYESYGYSDSMHRCANGVSASAGDEAVFAGDRSGCESSDWSSSDSAFNESYASWWSECTSQRGVFGPTGLGVYLITKWQDWSYGNGNGTEESGSWSGSGVGVSQDYVGTHEVYAPTVFLPLP